jgi:serine/threonine protein kinase
MERADVLTRLRGDHMGTVRDGPSRTGDTERFRSIFGESSPENARRIIMWCLERDPLHRPTAEELLMVCSTNNSQHNSNCLRLTLFFYRAIFCQEKLKLKNDIWMKRCNSLPTLNRKASCKSCVPCSNGRAWI